MTDDDAGRYDVSPVTAPQRLEQHVRPHTGAMDPANRTVLGVSLAVAGMMTMSVTALLMGNILGGSVFAVKFEEGTFPPNSAGVVQQGLVSVFAATVLAFVSAGLAASAVVIRPHTVVQVVGALMLMALIPVLLALWLCYGLAF